MHAAYPAPACSSQLNDAGNVALLATQSQCTFHTVPAYAFTRSSSLTVSGEPVSTLLQREPFTSVIAEQQIGNRRPPAPVLVVHSVPDDVMPYGQGRAMARS